MEDKKKSSSEKMILITTNMFKSMGMLDKLSEKDLNLVQECLKTIAWAGEIDEIRRQREFRESLKKAKGAYEITQP